MRVICTDGRFYEYDFPEDVRIDAEHVHAMLSRHVKPDGRIDDLCLDFSGSYLPIAHAGELRLVSALVVAYVMADQRLVNEVRATPSYTPPLPPVLFPPATLLTPRSRSQRGLPN
jgi:hypothetical protein